MRRKSCKIDITPEAHTIFKIESARSGISIKDFVSNLASNVADERTLELIKKNPNISKNQSFKRKKGYQENAKSIYDALFPNPLIGLTPAELSEITNIDIKEIIAILEHLYDGNKINRRERDNSFEYWKPAKASAEASQIYDVITIDSTKAETIEEIAKKVPNLSKSVVRTALYWLLKEGRVQRRLRENLKDRRKDSWEYWKLEPLSFLEERDIDLDALVPLIPTIDEGLPVSSYDLSNKLDIPASTIRGALRRLEEMGRISQVGNRLMLKPGHRYYRVG